MIKDEHLQVRFTGKRFPLLRSIACFQRTDFLPDAYDIKQYSISYTVHTLFKASPEGYEHAFQDAKKRLASGLYSPVLEALDQAITEIHNQDREAVLNTLFTLKKDLLESCY